MSGERLCALPIVPKDAIDRSFFMKTEVTSMDIAAHGALLVVGTSSGMILLFDLSNPLQQSGGLLIGQIRAKMVTCLHFADTRIKRYKSKWIPVKSRSHQRKVKFIWSVNW